MGWTERYWPLKHGVYHRLQLLSGSDPLYHPRVFPKIGRMARIATEFLLFRHIRLHLPYRPSHLLHQIR